MTKKPTAEEADSRALAAAHDAVLTPPPIEDEAAADPAAPIEDASAADPAVPIEDATTTDPAAPIEGAADPAAPIEDATTTDPAPVPGPFPAAALAAGQRARRAAWAPGFELVAAEAGGRNGQRLRLMTTGTRCGMVEWKPPHMADELLAQDWQVVVPVTAEPMP